MAQHAEPRTPAASDLPAHGYVITKPVGGSDTVIEGASHESLGVDTGPTAPRRDGVRQYQDKARVAKNADKAKSMAPIRRIDTPIPPQAK